MRSVLRQRPGTRHEDLERVRERMNDHVSDSLVSGYEHLIPSIELPDPNDRHVVAAAHHAKARRIVTFNLRDFPAVRLDPWGLTAQHPDAFILDLLASDADKVRAAASKHHRFQQRPPFSLEEYLDMLSRQGLAETVKALGEWHGYP